MARKGSCQQGHVPLVETHAGFCLGKEDSRTKHCTDNVRVSDVEDGSVWNLLRDLLSRRQRALSVASLISKQLNVAARQGSPCTWDTWGTEGTVFQ